MLTQEEQEQEQVLDRVRRIVISETQNRTRVRKGLMSERQRRVNSAKDFEELADLLKEIG